jgi:hypothetical protein
MLCYGIKLKVTVGYLALLLRIREVLGSNLASETGYSDGFS